MRGARRAERREGEDRGVIKRWGESVCVKECEAESGVVKSGILLGNESYVRIDKLLLAGGLGRWTC